MPYESLYKFIWVCISMMEWLVVLAMFIWKIARHEVH